MCTLRRLLLALLLYGLICQPVNGAVPPMINYQGKLMNPDGRPVSDGTYSITFTIYDAETGGNVRWSEPNVSVQVKGGLFAVLLGANGTNLPANIFDSPDRWFGIKVGNDPEMVPRQRISSVAYANKAASADIALTVPDGSISASKLAAGVAVPPGTIVMWSGSELQIPQGWALCNGQNGTPDLRDRFIVGAGSSYAVGATGGAAQVAISVAQLPSHGHGVTDPGHSHSYNDWGLDLGSGAIFGNGNSYRNMFYNWNTSGATTGISIQASGGGQPHENRPPYYALCFIMKLGY